MGFWTKIPQVITGVKALSKTGAESVAAWKAKAAKSKLKMAKENLDQTLKQTDKRLEKLKKTTDRIKWYQKPADKRMKKMKKEGFEGPTYTSSGKKDKSGAHLLKEVWTKDPYK